MTNRINQDAGAHAEPRSDANSADQQMASGQMSMRLQRISTLPAPKVIGIADARALEAHVERRSKLAERIRLENPSRTEEEIEARLEQFGA